jgi:YVTN family beta-propeller protein
MPHWTATSADSSTAYVTNELSNDLSVVDLGNQTVTATIAIGNAPRKIVVQQAATAAPTAAAMD